MLQGRLDQYQLEKRYLRKDGGTVWVNLNVSPKRNAQGAIEYFVSVIKDIGAQKAAQADLAALNANLERRVQERTAELEESNRRLREAIGRQQAAEAELRAREAEIRSVVENANDAYISLDEAGTITDWNRQAEVTFGWLRAEALGQKLEQLIIPEEHRTRHREGMERFLSTRVGNAVDQRLELPALRRDGGPLTVEVRIRALELNGRTMFSAFLHDISARKQEQAKR